MSSFCSEAATSTCAATPHCSSSTEQTIDPNGAYDAKSCENLMAARYLRTYGPTTENLAKAYLAGRCSEIFDHKGTTPFALTLQ